MREMNAILKFLADKECVEYKQKVYDLLIIAGNSLPFLVLSIDKLIADNIVNKILITGGIGHATNHLIANIKNSGNFSKFADMSGKPEAYIFKLLIQQKLGLSDEKILIETTSTNTGENACNTLELVKNKKLQVSKVLLLQDPILQRRTKATFKHVWKHENVMFTNFVPYVPQIDSIGAYIVFTDKRLNTFWEKKYFLSLLMGELPKLLDDSNGYGPNGKNYIAHVDIPENILEDYERLQLEFGKYIR
jgi:uncharacterized SAM-binding protein YcdF (DUF218 family)